MLYPAPNVEEAQMVSGAMIEGFVSGLYKSFKKESAPAPKRAASPSVTYIAISPSEVVPVDLEQSRQDGENAGRRAGAFIRKKLHL